MFVREGEGLRVLPRHLGTQLQLSHWMKIWYIKLCVFMDSLPEAQSYRRAYLIGCLWFEGKGEDGIYFRYYY